MNVNLKLSGLYSSLFILFSLIFQKILVVGAGNRKEPTTFQEPVDFFLHRCLFSNAALAVQIMHNESSSILIHGMEGRDMTLCVTTLAQLIADPSCRSFVGFQHLIHREWVLSGFQFACRNSSLLVQNRPKDSRRVASPVFLFCLDAIWQACMFFMLCFQSFILLTSLIFSLNR